MSRSQVYRPIQLSEEEIAEIGVRARQRRLANVEARLQAESLPTFEPCHEGATDPVALASDRDRPTRVDGTERGAEASALLRAPALTSTPPCLPATGTLPHEHADHTEVLDPRPETRALELELEDIERTAVELGVTLKGGGDARRALEAASTLASLRTAPSGPALDRLRAAVADLDGEVTSALIVAEARARTLAGVLSTLEAIGFHVVQSTAEGDATIVGGITSTGQEASIELCPDETGRVGLTITVIDPGTAVAVNHAAAADVCEAAVLTQVAIQRALQQLPGLQAGPIRAVGRPRRGGADEETRARPGPSRGRSTRR